MSVTSELLIAFLGQMLAMTLLLNKGISFEVFFFLKLANFKIPANREKLWCIIRPHLPRIFA